MNGAHLFLLTCRNLVSLARSKYWLIAEFTLPLILVSLQYYTKYSVDLGQQNLTLPKQDTSKIFTPFPIYGNYSDIAVLGSDKILGASHNLDYVNCILYSFNRTHQDYHRKVFKIIDQLESNYGKKILMKNILNESEITKTLEVVGDIIVIDDREFLVRNVVGLVFDRIRRNQIAYRFVIRAGNSEGWHTDKQWIDLFSYYSQMEAIEDKPLSPPYFDRHLLSYHAAILNVFSKKNPETDPKLPFLMLKAFPYYKSINSAYHMIMDSMPFFWSLTMIFTVIHTVGSIVSEKESKIKAYMAVLGVSNRAYFGSIYLVNFFKISLIMMLFIQPTFQYFKYVPIYVVVIVGLLYASAVVSFILFLSALFKTTISAMKISGFVWIGLCTKGFMFSEQNYNIFSCVFFSININEAFQLAISNIMWIEMRQQTLTPDLLLEEVFTMFNLASAIFMLLLDTIIYITAAMYLNAVFPSDGAPSKSTYEFFFGKGYKKDLFYLPTDIQNHHSTIQTNNEWDLLVKNCTKVWTSTGERALDSLSFKAAYGEITTLIGHNGSGKSSCFAVLAGMTNLDCGNIRLGKKNYLKKLSKTHTHIGYCPQYNAFFPKLTTREQLCLVTLLRKREYGVFFSTSSCFKKKEINDEIDEFMCDLELEDNRNEYASKLSGGIQRKVQVAMALTGQSKIILLDEPKSSMDIGSRVLVNKLLFKLKNSRTIVWATHLIDESSLLADKVLFLSKGRVAVGGGLEDLKRNFSSGYRFVVQYKTTCSPSFGDSLLHLIKNQIPTTSMEPNFKSNERVFIIPAHSKALIPDMFECLENSPLIKDIIHHELLLMTLNHAFLKIDEMVEMKHENLNFTANTSHYAKELFGSRKEELNKGFALLFQQLYALFHKHLHYIKKNWFIFLLQSLIPVGLILLKKAQGLKGYEDIPNDEHIYFNKKYLGEIRVPFWCPMNYSTCVEVFKSQYKDIKYLEAVDISQYMDTNAWYLRHFITKPYFAFGIELAVNEEIREVVVTMMFNNVALHSTMIAITEFFEIFGEISVDAKLKIVSPPGMNGNADMTSMETINNDEVFDNPWMIDITDDSVAALLALVLFAVMHSSHSIVLINEELNSKFQHQQMMSNLSRRIYWLGNFLFNLVTFTFGVVMLNLMIWYAYGDVFYGLDVSIGTTILLYAYFLANTPVVWIMSYWFKKPYGAYPVLLALQVPLPMAFIMGGISVMALVHYADPNVIFVFVAVLSPAGCLVIGFSTICGHVYSKEPSLELFINSDFVYIQVVRGILTYILFSLSENDSVNLFVKQNLKRTLMSLMCGFEKPVKFNYDPDLKPSFEDESVVVKVHQLCKKSKKKVILDCISFDLHENECFGLLGCNSAGKSTTFNVLTNMIFPSYGAVYVNGISSLKQKKRIGYCQQIDAFLVDLKVKQVLYLIANLNGFKDWKRRVNIVIDCFMLERHLSKEVKKLSGGERRCLSVAVAILSTETLIVLDEPTNSADPKIRRFLWELLNAIRKYKITILLSSHNIEECNFLCSKVGFLHASKLSDVGTVQGLKKRYANGFSVGISLSNPSALNWNILENRLKVKYEFIKQMFSPHQVSVEWIINPGPGITWISVFRYMEKIAAEYCNEIESGPRICDYTVSQCSLEEVIIRLFQEAENLQD